MSKYLILSLDDAKLVLAAAAAAIDETNADAAARALQRLRDDTGADIEDIVRQLKAQKPCAAAVIEAQWCDPASHANAMGRRLARLLERANHTRSPGDVPDPTASP